MTKRKLLEAKASLRRGRRYRKVRYRHPKWKPKTRRVYCKVPDRKGRHWQKQKNTFTSNRMEGWLPPSLQSKTDHHIRWIRKLQDLLPEGYRLSIELGRFDLARMKDPGIHGNCTRKGRSTTTKLSVLMSLPVTGIPAGSVKRKAGSCMYIMYCIKATELRTTRSIWQRYVAAAIPQRTISREVSFTSGCRDRKNSPEASGMPHL